MSHLYRALLSTSLNKTPTHLGHRGIRQLKKADSRSGIQEIRPNFMKCSREATMGSCTEPDESS
jgi:hypothetical protein